MFRFILVLLSVLLTACSSVPLSTMVKFSNYDKNDFFRIDPSQLRVKATINQVVDIDLSKATTLSAAIGGRDTNSKLVFQLEQVKTEVIPAVKGVFNNEPAYKVHYMKLTEQSINNFNQLIKAAENRSDKQGQFQAGLSWDKPIDAKGETIVFSVALKLATDEPYFTLIDQFELAIPNKE